jgi:Family of unknown function (DUF6152)
MTIRLFARRLGLCAIAAATFAITPAFAHHSFSAYDMTRTETVSGSIKEFRWGAPHSSMVVIYVDKKGKQQAMSVATGTPVALTRQGFSPRDFRSGEKVTITYHPNVSGGAGGAMSSMTLADGRSYRDNEAVAAENRGAPPPAVEPPAK